MTNPELVIVAGSSRAGTSTLVNGFRDLQYESSLVLPLRLSTRPEREDDDPRETQHLDRNEFEQRVDDGLIYPSWVRALDIGAPKELYGFKIISPEDKRLPIYAANIAFLQSKDKGVLEIREKGVIVVVAAKAPVRAARLQEAKDMPVNERNYRLNHEADRIDPNIVDHTIRTDSLTDAQGQQLLKDIVLRTLDQRES